MKRILMIPALVSATLLVGCQTEPTMTQQLDSITGLQSVQGTTFDKLALESPEKLAKYRAIYVAPLDLGQLEIDTRRLDAGDREWTLSATERAKIAGYFSDSVMSSFRNSALPLARNPGPDVLVAELALIKFTPSAPKDDVRSRGARTEIFTYNVGDLEMTGRLKDSVSGATLGYLADTAAVGDTIYLERNDRLNNVRKLKNTLNEWTAGLAEALDMLGDR